MECRRLPNGTEGIRVIGFGRSELRQAGETAGAETVPAAMSTTLIWRSPGPPPSKAAGPLNRRRSGSRLPLCDNITEKTELSAIITPIRGKVEQ